MTTKVTIANEPNDIGHNVKVTVTTYGSDTVRVVAPGETIEDWLHQEQSILIEEGDFHEG